MKTDLNFPRPPFSDEVEIVGTKVMKAKKSKNKRVRYILGTTASSPSQGIACSCEGSQNLGQKFGRAGSDKERTIEHGLYGIWEIESVIKPQRWRCSHCKRKFNHNYKFVGKKKKYSEVCRENFASSAEISSAKKASKQHGIPARTGHTIFYDEYLVEMRKKRERDGMERALAQGNRLVIGIDDTSTRKGKDYATYIYDVKTKAVLAVIKGRTYEELMDYYQQNPHLHRLNPAVVAVDRAPAYTKFIKEVFPHALIVFDRFHIAKNVRDHALYPAVRSTLRDKRFAPTIEGLLLHLIERDCQGKLSDQGRAMLRELLCLSKKLRKKYDKVVDLLSYYDRTERFYPEDFSVFRSRMANRLYGELADCVREELKSGKYLSKIKELVRGLLNRRYRDGLIEWKGLFLERVFQLANWYRIKESYEFVEEVGKWYDANHPTFAGAYNDLHAIIEKGLQSARDHKGIKKGAESLKRGQQSIANYHRGDKATNALVEGKNCVTKLDFRQRFGVRTWRNYENLAIVLRNSHLEDDQWENLCNVS